MVEDEQLVVLANGSSPHRPTHRLRVEHVVVRVHERQRVQQIPVLRVDVLDDGQVLALLAYASHHTSTSTVEPQHDVVHHSQQTQHAGANVHVSVVTLRILLREVAQLEGIDQVEAVLQRGSELGGRGEMAVELFDEIHNVDGERVVEKRGDGRELVGKLALRERRENT